MKRKVMALAIIFTMLFGNFVFAAGQLHFPSNAASGGTNLTNVTEIKTRGNLDFGEKYNLKSVKITTNDVEVYDANGNQITTFTLPSGRTTSGPKAFRTAVRTAGSA